MDLWALADLCTPWCVHVAVTLRVAEHLNTGNTTIAGIAPAAGADPEALHRVLRHLVAKGLFEEPSPGVFALNEAARQLLEPATRLAFDLDGFGSRMAGAWGTLLSAVRTGRPAYHEAFGRPYWEDLDAHPRLAADFDALMGPAGHGTPDPHVLADPADWEQIRTVVDVGGGTGSLLAEILRAHPHLSGTLVELPRTVARAADVLQSAGVADRVTVAAQSFFDPLPPGHDLYVISKVLCDWPDTEATAILRRCADAAGPSGRVVAVGEGAPVAPSSGDLLMMVLIGGKDRTLDDFRPLATDAGLEVRRVGRQSGGRHFVELSVRSRADI
ncbi:MAG: hydroxyneurosporene-O-methyltransferase [Candidatus Solibacter sp.]|nr:hydroxyneurosporene-O-methyltransferase [Candidatus Solibacter sp.]